MTSKMDPWSGVSEDTHTVTPIDECPTVMYNGDVPDPTKLNCFYYSTNWDEWSQSYSDCPKSGSWNHETKEWAVECEDPSVPHNFTGCYAETWSGSKYNGG
jgi:hypothetical protein